MIFPVLYKRAANSSIRQWSIEISQSASSYTRRSGQLHGTITSVVDTLTEGKVNRTVYEQLKSEAQSYYNKQLDNGYKSLEQLGCTINELENILPKYNTDAQGNIKPMLAKAVQWDKLKWPVFVQPKLDGVRCLMIVKDGAIQFFSRSGKPYTTLKHISDSFNAVEDFVLDGEIYSHDITFQEIISAVKLLGPNSQKLHFRAYDIVSEHAQAERIELYMEHVTMLNSPYIHSVSTKQMYNKDEVMAWHDELVQQNYEGAMIRMPSGIYQQGVRSSHLRKVKVFNEEEFFCTELITGKRDEDLIAVCLTNKNKEFKAKLMGSTHYKQIVEANFQMGDVLTVKFFGWTDDELPRFPIGKAFRDDV